MKRIRITPNPSGAYSAIQEGSLSTLPEDMAIWPDELSTTDFYAHNGFVTLEVEVQDGVNVVTGYTPNTELWEPWKAAEDEKAAAAAEEEAKPTMEERVTTLEEQLAETDEVAIELYEASLAQEAINAEQDEAIIEIYEMMEVTNNG